MTTLSKQERVEVAVIACLVLRSNASINTIRTYVKEDEPTALVEDINAAVVDLINQNDVDAKGTLFTLRTFGQFNHTPNTKR